MHFHHQALAVNGIKCLTMHGNLSTAKRQEVLETFQDPESGYQVLLMSDVGTCGLNIQAAHIIIFIVSCYKLIQHKFHTDHLSYDALGSAMVCSRLSSNHWKSPSKGTKEARLCLLLDCRTDR